MKSIIDKFDYYKFTNDFFENSLYPEIVQDILEESEDDIMYCEDLVFDNYIKSYIGDVIFSFLKKYTICLVFTSYKYENKIFSFFEHLGFERRIDNEKYPNKILFIYKKMKEK